MAGVKTLSPLLPGEKRFCGRRALGQHWCRGSYFGGSGTGSRVPTNVGPTMQKLSRQSAADHDTLEQDKPLSLIPSEIKKPCPAESDNLTRQSNRQAQPEQILRAVNDIFQLKLIGPRVELQNNQNLTQWNHILRRNLSQRESIKALF